jgi:putative phosphoesterase
MGMRIAVLADIHGNVWALDAVLERLEALQLDQVVNLGDCFWGPLAPGATFERLREREGWLTVRGNQDRVLLEGGDAATDRFTLDELEDAGIAWVERRTSRTLHLGTIFACHGTPDGDDDTLIERVESTHVRWASPEELTRAIGGVGTEPEVVLCGHSHRPAAVRAGDGRLIVNPGSVGLPAYDHDRPHPHKMEAGSSHARWAVLEVAETGWSVDQMATPYDVVAAAAAARRRGREDWALWIETGRAS